MSGARGTHNLDVLISFSQIGLSVNWIVECKYWKARVTKEKVLALHQIVQDVGADKAFLLSETGFQAGAIRVARNTNVVLTSISDLRENAKDLAQEVAIAPLARRLTALNERVSTYIIGESGGPEAPPGVCLESMLDLSGVLLMLRLGLSKVLAGGLPVHGHTVAGASVTIADISAFVTFAEREMDAVVDGLDDADKQSAGALASTRDVYDLLGSSITEFLSVSESALHVPASNAAEFEQRRRRALEPMKLVGFRADDLRALVRGTGRKKLGALMRCLCDGVYLDLAQEAPDLDKFHANRDRAMKALRDLHDEIARASGGNS